MAEHLDLEKHRHTLTSRIEALGKDLEHTSAGSQALYEFTKLLHGLVENLEASLNLQKAELLLFQKIILANARLSPSYEEFQAKCAQTEKQLGFFKGK